MKASIDGTSTEYLYVSENPSHSQDKTSYRQQGTKTLPKILALSGVLCVLGGLALLWTFRQSYFVRTMINEKGFGAEVACSTLEFVSRREWGARDPKEPPTHIPPTNMTFLHHSAGQQCFDKESCIKTVKGIQNFHMDTRGWDDIGYNFLVGEDGRVYEGRGWLVQGAQAPTYNAVSHGICIMGNFMKQLPNEKAIATAKALMVFGVEHSYILADYELFGHRDGRCTDCPGDMLYQNLQSWPHYSTRKIPIYCPT